MVMDLFRQTNWCYWFNREISKWSPKSIARIFARLDDDENEGISADEFTFISDIADTTKAKAGDGASAQRVIRMTIMDDDNGEEPAEDNGEEPS